MESGATSTIVARYDRYQLDAPSGLAATDQSRVFRASSVSPCILGNGSDHSRGFGRAAALVLLAGWIAGCADLNRLAAVPVAGTKQATILGMTNARFVVDEAAPVALAAEFRRPYDREVKSLGSAARIPSGACCNFRERMTN
jgi:hypothetical protein